jgi:hypothetical protein
VKGLPLQDALGDAGPVLAVTKSRKLVKMSPCTLRRSD